MAQETGGMTLRQASAPSVAEFVNAIMAQVSEDAWC